MESGYRAQDKDSRLIMRHSLSGSEPATELGVLLFMAPRARSYKAEPIWYKEENETRFASGSLSERGACRDDSGSEGVGETLVASCLASRVGVTSCVSSMADESGKLLAIAACRCGLRIEWSENLRVCEE